MDAALKANAEVIEEVIAEHAALLHVLEPEPFR